MKKLHVACLILLTALMTNPFSTLPAHTKSLPPVTLCQRQERARQASHLRQDIGSQTSSQALIVTPQAVNVSHYKLQIQLTPEPAKVAGRVTIEGQTTAPVSMIQVDAFDNLIINSVQFDGRQQDYQRTASQIILNFPGSLAAGETFTIVVDYHGVPVVSGVLGGGMLMTRHNNIPVIATLSEPYAGPSWWPCIDNPADKATVELQATVPRSYVATSNGVLERVEPTGNQMTTYYWRENYLVAPYLVAVSATNYVKFEDTYRALDGATTMPLVYYVYPEHLTPAQQKFAITRQAVEIYASLFGEYPFLAEKYGMVEFPWSGAMEHQTLTSMGTGFLLGNPCSPSDGRCVIAHELSHQWWGDWVTMATWHDVWLNEGFATYAEVLFAERLLNLNPGDLMDRSYDDHRASGALRGTVYAEDLENPWDDSAAIYVKGAWVLHMLRHVMTDEPFFAALKDYGRRFAFSNASTEDFQRVCEDHYGAPLDWFFQQWVYAPARPIYRVSSYISSADASGNYTINLTIEQQQSQLIPGREGELANVYIMPIDVTIHYADGGSETRVVRNDARQQQFSFTVSKRPVSVGLDEGHWILKEFQMN
ncbi:MAG: M1 family metallopeptidase [Acidobacteria bacterium]|nr:M1 family metallopeptidase [Acidobacteriota bacterium]